MAMPVELVVTIRPAFVDAARAWVRLMWAAHFVVGDEHAYRWAEAGAGWILQRGIRTKTI